jgi:hypothetical protein
MSDADIAARLRRLEDEAALRRLMDLVWLLADNGPVAAFADLYTDDCVIDLGRLVTPDRDTLIEGIDAIRARYATPAASARLGQSHHLAGGPQAIVIDGDQAQAVSYALNSGLVDGVAKVGVTGFNFFRFARRSGRWRISRRTARRLGDNDVIALFRPIVRRVLDDLA